MQFCKWYERRPFLKWRSHFTTARISSFTLWLSRCPQWWMQMGQCSLSAQMWDPLQGHWEMLHSVDSLKSWSKCSVSSTRKPVTWRRRRWGLLITISLNPPWWQNACTSWLHKRKFQFIAVVLWKPKSADIKNSCSHCLITQNCFVLLQSKLDDYQVRKNNGERLNHDQLVNTFCRWTQIILRFI